MIAPDSAGRKAGSDRPPARRRQAGRSEIEAMEREVEHIPALDRAVLLERFVKLCGFQPPPRFSRKLMELAVAYKLQEQVLGGLKTATRRFLLDAAKAQHCADEGMEGRHAPGHRAGRRLSVRRKAVSKPLRDRRADNRWTLVRADILWPDEAGTQGRS
jgi:hypothetical protein